MGQMNIAGIYAYIHKTLRNDSKIQEMLGIFPSSTPEDMEVKIQKRKKPQNLLKDTLPIISFYKEPGERGINFLEYQFIIKFDIYTQDNVELAINIAERVCALFDDKSIAMKEGSFFKTEYVTSAEDNTDLENTYKYFIQIRTTIGLEE